jgi:hypothetical protein
LVKEYNAEVSELPPDPRNPSLLSKDVSNQLLAFDSDLFETDRFLCNQRWASERGMRRAIILAHSLERAREELLILAEELERYSNSLSSQLVDIQAELQTFKGEGPCGISGAD